MPSRKTTKVAAMPSMPKDLVDQFVTGPMSAEAVESISLPPCQYDLRHLPLRNQ